MLGTGFTQAESPAMWMHLQGTALGLQAGQILSFMSGVCKPQQLVTDLLFYIFLQHKWAIMEYKDLYKILQMWE